MLVPVGDMARERVLEEEKAFPRASLRILIRIFLSLSLVTLCITSPWPLSSVAGYQDNDTIIHNEYNTYNNTTNNDNDVTNNYHHDGMDNSQIKEPFFRASFYRSHQSEVAPVSWD